MSVGEVELGRQLLSILNAEILLLLEASLQSLELVIGEGRSGLPLFPGVHLAAAGRRVFRRRSRIVI